MYLFLLCVLIFLFSSYFSLLPLMFFFYYYCFVIYFFLNIYLHIFISVFFKLYIIVYKLFSLLFKQLRSSNFIHVITFTKKVSFSTNARYFSYIIQLALFLYILHVKVIIKGLGNLNKINFFVSKFSKISILIANIELII